MKNLAVTCKPYYF